MNGEKKIRRGKRKRKWLVEIERRKKIRGKMNGERKIGRGKRKRKWKR